MCIDWSEKPELLFKAIQHSINTPFALWQSSSAASWLICLPLSCQSIMNHRLCHRTMLLLLGEIGKEWVAKEIGRCGWRTEVEERLLTVLTEEDWKDLRENVMGNEGGGLTGVVRASEGVKYDSGNTAYGVQGSRERRDGWKPWVMSTRELDKKYAKKETRETCYKQELCTMTEKLVHNQHKPFLDRNQGLIADSVFWEIETVGLPLQCAGLE